MAADHHRGGQLDRSAELLLEPLAGGRQRPLEGLPRVPDLPFEEAPEVLEACDARGVALVPLVAPTTPDDRLARIGERARGFLYTVSATGTTGERTAADFAR